MYLLVANSKKPLYQQLYQQIRAKILSGELSAQAKLPSCRYLATELHISRNTVDTAYQQLLSEGYIVGKSRSGYYIETIHNTKYSAFTEAVSDTPTGKLQPDGMLYDFRYGNLSQQSFPFAQWQRLTNFCLKQDKEQFLNYSDFRGEPGLRRELVKYLYEYRDVRCTADQILITSGTIHCLTVVCQLLRNAVDAIAMEDPGFAAAHLAFTNHGFQVPLVPVNHHGLNVKALRTTTAQAVYVTPSHQFPTGQTMSITRRLQLIDWAYEREALIIEDDYNCHLRYDVKPAPALQGLAPDKVIYIGSFSKILSPSLRVSYAVLPKSLALRLQQKNENYACSVPLLIQKPLELFLQENLFESHLRKMLRQFKRKRDILLRALQEHFGDVVTVSGGNAGLHILLHLNQPVSSANLVDRAVQAGVYIHGDNIWVESSPGKAARVLLGFGAIKNEDIDSAVRLLCQAWLN
ncbi:PLP-dependent aminotransferase family protein [Sporomusa sp. KB1]|jgi:GntR family transcriptional regulator/MocR family aminotransferase|uniref:MocR-like pyridoxine biosynthesis transcription factor PdxR n=1 Tax=Sporomusa sp. KB1 TaxID=943346 RepID=UPI0011A43893|nr:PLP-dependent aminotransferase family protein [Sporomusa sp. KB1]TWH47905.1 GntR family transcriptional regulator/MocR family aminotransferase [Sporomusa sp. KB1]